MSKNEEKVKLGLGMFCSVCILTMVFLITNGDQKEMLTSLHKEEKTVNVVFSKSEERNQVLVEPYDIVDFENIGINGTSVEDFEVTFDNKSGVIDYTFYIENKSLTDAVLEEYELPNPICKGFQEDCEKVLDDITYRIKYESGSNLKAGDVFKAREKTKVILTVKYNADDNNLPSASFDITNLDFSLSFKAK